MKDIYSDKLHEECAVFGVSVQSGAAGLTFNGLLSLQHRGQEGAGIAVLDGHKIEVVKGEGLIREAVTFKMIDEINHFGSAIGHARYSTKGGSEPQYIQPYVTEFLTGRIATAHNGNITNVHELRKKLIERGLDISTETGSELIPYLIAYHLTKKPTISAIIDAANELEGAFSLVVLTSDNKIVAVRDRYGYRPLCLGEDERGIVVASESCAIEAVGFNFVRDVQPGELVVIENGKITHSQSFCTTNESRLCVFEYVYFARPDSIVDKLSVYESRVNMGKILAKEHPANVDLVCGMPDSGLEAAAGYSTYSGIPLASGFVKNRYLGRSFIYPSQNEREFAVRMKLTPLRANIEGKRIVLVDDSIVRGTTCALIIKALRRAGVKEVHLRISSPPFRHTCHYGTDVDSEENLIANKLTTQQICKRVGADSLAYLSLEGLKQACGGCNLSFCTGCFDGHKDIK